MINRSLFFFRLGSGVNIVLMGQNRCLRDYLLILTPHDSIKYEMALCKPPVFKRFQTQEQTISSELRSHN
jgi:hypothetical protein